MGTVYKPAVDAKESYVAETEETYNVGIGNECPICAKYRDPVTGEEQFNAETVAAIEEGRAMMRGEIPAKRFHSLEEMWEDLMRDDPEDE